jgi:hypothetical protein
MKKEKTEQTAEQVRMAELMSKRFLTVDGKLTIPQMIQRFGLPIAILKMAKVEARTGLVVKPTIVVERFVDGELFFNKDLVVSGIQKALLLQMEYAGIKTEYIRHPTYNPQNMIKATEKEIRFMAG